MVVVVSAAVGAMLAGEFPRALAVLEICGGWASTPGGEVYSCTRADGHPCGVHVAHGPDGVAVAWWPGGAVPGVVWGRLASEGRASGADAEADAFRARGGR